jgi:transposase-like protein/IS1 family transposase
MTCHSCSIECKRFGKHRNGLQRFRCRQCHKTFTEDHDRPLDDMRLPLDRATAILSLLCEGMSVRSVERVTGVHRDTILRLLVLAGERCQRVMQRKIEAIPVRDVEADEIWGYVGKKQASLWPYEQEKRMVGDAYCFVAMERTSKLVLTFHLGKRTQRSTDAFITKLRMATADSHFQITTDGFRPYVQAIHTILQDKVSFAQLVKVYASPRDGEQRYSPGDVVDAKPLPVFGRPDMKRVCTSHIERQNLSIRMGMRRMTRLTNAFSKKWENLEAAYALWFAYYNFCRVHRTLRVTPAMESGITGHQWTIQELLAA